MAKPPKKVSTSNTSDTSLTHPKFSPGDNLLWSDHSGSRFRTLQDAELTPDTQAATVLSDVAPHRPVVVAHIPVHGGSFDTAAASMISWPREQIDQLFQIDDTGLFMSAEQQLYADIEDQGIFRIEPNVQGKYQVHFPFAAGQPGTILVKIQGQPRWRMERQGLISLARDTPLSIPGLGASMNQAMRIIQSNLADRLTKPDERGLRYDKLKRIYVDVVDEGTVMVRRNADGQYQETSSGELTPSGPVLEGIDGMTLWQRKAPNATTTDDSPQLDAYQQTSTAKDLGPGPSKRPRLDENVETSDTVAGAEHIAAPENSNPYLWASWAKTSKPDAVDSIQIGQLHYQIVPTGPLAEWYPLVFLQHPQFAPSRFEAFERMLHEAPSLQPVAVVNRTGTDFRKVSGVTPLFEKPLTQHIADTFKGFTGDTSRAVAKRLFELSSGSKEVNGVGLARMKQTFRNWEGESAVGVPGLGDPLDMLPVAIRTEGSRQIIALRSPNAGETLQQLDFNPSHSWKIYANNPTAMNLKTLFIKILNESGYDTFTPDAVTHFNSLVFRRPNHNKIYFLKLGTVKTDGLEIRTPLVPELEDPLLINQMSAEINQLLVAANARNDVVWLIGGVQHQPTKSPSIFIIRDR